ncbi:MAG: ATP synthase subunit I [Pseudomonadales bacterium]|jgi:F1F0 ATPase subunit 2
MSVAGVIAGALLGLLLGAVYFALLYRSVRIADTARAGGQLTLLLLRGTLAVAGFWGLAQLGAAPLLAGLAGFLIARHLVRRLVVAPG